MNPDPSQNHQVRIFLSGVLQNFFENLSVQKTDGAFDIFFFTNFPGNLQMSLIDFCQSLVDDIFMKLFLLLKLEHFGSFPG